MNDINVNNDRRIMARNLARELTVEETALVAGQIGATAQMLPKQTSTCSASDNNSCDLDNWNSH
jgi:hypothetical protein